MKILCLSSIIMTIILLNPCFNKKSILEMNSMESTNYDTRRVESMLESLNKIDSKTLPDSYEVRDHTKGIDRNLGKSFLNKIAQKMSVRSVNESEFDDTNALIERPDSEESVSPPINGVISDKNGIDNFGFEDDEDVMDSKDLPLIFKKVQSKEKIILDLNQFTDLADTFELDNQQKKCLLLRSYMNYLPGFRPVETGWLSIFRLDSHKNPNSLRTFALNLLEKLQLLEHKPDGIPEDQDYVSKLRIQKQQYYLEYVLPNLGYQETSEHPKDIIDKKKDLDVLLKDLVKYDNDLGELRKSHSDFEYEMKLKISEVESVDSLFKNLVFNKKQVEEEIEKLKTFDTVKDLDFLDQQLCFSLGAFELFLKLKNFVYMQKSSNIRNDVLKKIRDLYKKDSRYQQMIHKSNKFVRIQRTVKINKSSLTKIDNAISELTRKILDLYEDQKTSLEKKLEKIEGMKDYTELFKKLVSVEKRLKSLKDKGLILKNEIENIELFIQERGVDTNPRLDFILSDQLVETVEGEYTELFQLMKELGENPQPLETD